MPKGVQIFSSSNQLPRLSVQNNWKSFFKEKDLLAYNKITQMKTDFIFKKTPEIKQKIGHQNAIYRHSQKAYHMADLPF